jgi:gamma-glutamyltranspeptidase/glutathione hydrolase
LYLDALAMSYGVMGGYMQPQGHVQVLLNMIEFGMNPQEALNQPRILVGGGYKYVAILYQISYASYII